MTKNLKIILITLFIFQICIASSFELAHDEAYYWLYSKNLDWGYFDHPPLVGLVIRFFSFLPHSEIGVRIGFVILQFGSLGFLMKLIPKEKWLETTLLYFAFPLVSFGGLMALPDMPLVFMTAAYCLALKNFLVQSDVKSSALLGLVIALLLNAKYHGILLVFFTLMALPSLFKKKEFYLVAVVAILFFLPHVWWQYVHDFSTLKYHFLERPKAPFSLGRSAEYIGLQVVLAAVLAGPLVWWHSFNYKSQDPFDRAMKFMAYGIVVFFFISGFSKKFEANWTILVAIPLIYLATKGDHWKNKIYRGLTWASFALVVSLRLLFVAPASLSFIPKRINEFHGWKAWAQSIAQTCQVPVMANTYQLASKLSFYLNAPVHALNFHSRKNQFDYWGPDEAYYQTGEVCYLTDKKNFNGENTYTPEGKRLTVAKGFSLRAYQEIKSQSN